MICLCSIFVDMILLTRCDGLIIASDGGLAHMFLLASCARRIDGTCPSHMDLWQCQPEAMMSHLPPIANNNTINVTPLSILQPAPPIPYRFVTDPMLNPIWIHSINQQVHSL